MNIATINARKICIEEETLSGDIIVAIIPDWSVLGKLQQMIDTEVLLTLVDADGTTTFEQPRTINHVEAAEHILVIYLKEME